MAQASDVTVTGPNLLQWLLDALKTGAKSTISDLMGNPDKPINKPVQLRDTASNPTPVQKAIELTKGNKNPILGYDPSAELASQPIQNAIKMQNNPANIENTLRQGLTNYGGKNLPMLNYLPEVVNATNQYDLFKNNPYLIPAISIAETSGGRNITRPNNLINYGVRDSNINNIFSEVGPREALRRSLKEIGGTGKVYDKYRTGKPLSDTELQDFANTYEPMNKDYYNNLKKAMKYFE